MSPLREGAMIRIALTHSDRTRRKEEEKLDRATRAVAVTEGEQSRELS
jgi:hypothetical protein